jgi:hypothetical protein
VQPAARRRNAVNTEEETDEAQARVARLAKHREETNEAQARVARL